MLVWACRSSQLTADVPTGGVDMVSPALSLLPITSPPKSDECFLPYYRVHSFTSLNQVKVQI